MADKAMEAQSNNSNSFTELETRDMDEVRIFTKILAVFLNYVFCFFLGTIPLVFVLVQS
jgi:hypothetical protein